MSDPPVIFKRTKFKANQRAREEQQPDAQDQRVQSTEAEPSPSAVASKIKTKAKQRVKQKTSLSFGAEEEGSEDVFKIKKSTLSQKLTLRQHPASPGTPPSNLDQASISPHTDRGPVYDEAYLNELKASTPSSRPRLPEGNDGTPIHSVLGDSAMQILDTIGNDTEVAAIPSQSAVLAAKEKRERMRAAGPSSSHADEYISLSLTTRVDEYQGPHPESRLMREDDDLGEGDDDFAEYTSAKTRIALGKKAKKAETNKLREEMQGLIADAEEIDEETQEWENAQIKRSGLKDEGPSVPATTPIYKPTPIPPLTEIPSLESSVMRLSQTITSVTASHAQNSTSISTLSAEQVQLDGREAELRDIVTRAEGKRSWFADFRDWLESVATFLDEKFPPVEKLENEHVSILKERRDMIQARRRAEDEDDLSMFLGSRPTLPHTGPEELDEMGRIIPRFNAEATRDDRRTARAARRALRRRNGRQGEDEEGYSTDATLPPSDAADYLAALQQLSRQRDEILSDVKAKEFKDPMQGIGARFATWRERFDDSYIGAWGGLALVGAWEFWARLEILGWNPFQDSRTLDSFRWYANLYEYSRPTVPHEDTNMPEFGPDGDLVSATITTVVLPRLAKLLEGGALDPFSGKDIRRLVDLAEEVEISVERSNPKFQMFLKTALSVFQNAVNDFMSLQEPFLAQDNPPFHPEAVPARKRVLARQKKLIINIIRWRKYTKSLFDIDEVANSFLVDCILPVARSGWDVGGEVCINRIAQQLPNELATSQTKAQLGILES